MELFKNLQNRLRSTRQQTRQRPEEMETEDGLSRQETEETDTTKLKGRSDADTQKENGKFRQTERLQADGQTD